MMMFALFCATRLCGGAMDISTIQDVSFTAECDGTQQKYVLLYPPEFKAELPHDVLIALHGHGSDRWQFIKDGRDECRAARDFAAEHKMLYVSPDYRAKTSWMGPKAEADVVQIIQDVKRTYRVSRVFLCGASMGGTSSLTFAVLHPDLIDGVASMNGTANFLEYENFQDAIQASFGGSKTDIPVEYKKRSAEFWPERLTMPVGLAVSGKDTAVPPQSVLRLAEALKAKEGKVLLIYREGKGHCTQYADAKAILEFALTNARPSSATAPSNQAPEDTARKLADPQR
jgi:pimeloyl-ACP methyl ester carboxylesterase